MQSKLTFARVQIYEFNLFNKNEKLFLLYNSYISSGRPKNKFQHFLENVWIREFKMLKKSIFLSGFVKNNIFKYSI